MPPGGIAAIDHDATAAEARLAADVAQLTGWLVRETAVARSVGVLLLPQTLPLVVPCCDAILRADAVVVPVNPMSRSVELARRPQDTGARVCLAGQDRPNWRAPLLAEGVRDHVVASACADAAGENPAFPLPPPLGRPCAAAVETCRIVPLVAALAAGHAPGPAPARPHDRAVIPCASGPTDHPTGCVHTDRTVQAAIAGGLAGNRAGRPSPFVRSSTSRACGPP